MSGPIVRSGPSPEFTKNWDQAFGGKKKAAKKGATAVAKKPATKKKSAKKSPKKTARKK